MSHGPISLEAAPINGDSPQEVEQDQERRDHWQILQRQEVEERDNLYEISLDANEDRSGREDGWRKQRPNELSLQTVPASKFEPDSWPSVLIDATSSPYPTHFPNPVATSPESKDVDEITLEQTDFVSPDLPPDIPADYDSPLAFDVDEFDAEQRKSIERLHQEQETRWFLNVCMKLNDNTCREKYFITYAETPAQWHRVTVSVNLKSPLKGSLEADLVTITSEREKNFLIYRSLRESLPEIEFLPTVTNLRLWTDSEDENLHVEVREDSNESMMFPAIGLFAHIPCPLYNDSILVLEKHIYGFVYKVRIGEQIFIKKEIPGRTFIDEFIYEIDALNAVLGARNVINLAGLVTNAAGDRVKALLTPYAARGSLFDILCNLKEGDELAWPLRDKWARQIVCGLSDIHEAGFVQGDLTLNNIVIDGNKDASIIDINRRGCPIDWEPPELLKLINNGQRISMHIGVKTDLYQLGMVLWALASQEAEPGRVARPLPEVGGDVPQYFNEIVNICLSDRPRERQSARNLLAMFPPTSSSQDQLSDNRMLDFLDKLEPSSVPIPTYMDPRMAMTFEDLQDRQTNGAEPASFATGDVTRIHPGSHPYSTIQGSGDSESGPIDQRSRVSRGRSLGSSRQRRFSAEHCSPSSATSLSVRSYARLHGRDGDWSESDCEPKCHEEDSLISAPGAACLPPSDAPRAVSKPKIANDGDVARPQPESSDSSETVEAAGQPLAGTKSDTATGAEDFESRPSKATTVSLSGLDGRPLAGRPLAELLHVDSGFDEQME